MSKIKNIVMISLVILFSFISSIRIEQPRGKPVTAADVKGFASDCLSGLVGAMPPGFCWKKGGDFGTIPTDCPKGYFRSLALCYQECNPGFTHILGVCYQGCGAGYADHGLTCYKSFFDFYFKPSYVPRSLTNFSSEIPCPGNMYRFGAMCYRDCNLIGMQNCGQGACIAEGASCALKIAEMTAKVFEGVATGVASFVTMGASAPARSAGKVAIKAAIKAIKSEAIDAAKAAVKAALKGKLKDALIRRAKAKVIDLTKDKIAKESKDKAQAVAKSVAMQSMCETVWNNLAGKQLTAPDVDSLGSKVLDAFDTFGVQSVFKQCSDPESDGGLGCAKSIMEGMSNFDPTGILTIASAFMYPECEVPVSKPAEPVYDFTTNFSAQVANAKKAQDIVYERFPKFTFNADTCVVVFDQVNFKGNRMDICGSLAKNLVNPQLVDFNDKIASFIVGKDVEGYFFEEANYSGRYLKFSKGSIVDDVAKFGTSTGVSLKGLISSIWFGNDEVISYRAKNKTNTFVLNSAKTKAVFTPTMGRLKNVSQFISFYSPNGRTFECHFTNNGQNLLKIQFKSGDVSQASSWPRSECGGCFLL